MRPRKCVLNDVEVNEPGVAWLKERRREWV